MNQYCCDILCPELATFKIVYSEKLDLGEYGFTFSCQNHLESLKLDVQDETRRT